MDESQLEELVKEVRREPMLKSKVSWNKDR